MLLLYIYKAYILCLEIAIDMISPAAQISPSCF